MNFEELVVRIKEVNDHLAHQAVKAVNLGLTLRNWVIGCHLHEYELRGEDRSQYGDRLFGSLAEKLTKHGLSNCNRRSSIGTATSTAPTHRLRGRCPHN